MYDTAKPYTPIFFTDDSIEFLIRLYPNGKFGQYLKTVKVGDIVHVRGPYGNFKYENNRYASYKIINYFINISLIFIKI